jgi:hypothetical protein
VCTFIFSNAYLSKKNQNFILYFQTQKKTKIKLNKELNKFVLLVIALLQKKENKTKNIINCKHHHHHHWENEKIFSLSLFFF